jgi:hypothetical protein
LLKALANHKTNNDITGGYINPETKTLKSATFKIAEYIQQNTAIEEQNIVNLKTATN